MRSMSSPRWLPGGCAHLQPDWIARYAHRSDEYRLPNGTEAPHELVATSGTDGTTLLTAIYAEPAPVWLRAVPAVETLRRVWLQNDVQTEEGVRWCFNDDLPPSVQFLNSPHDPDAQPWEAGQHLVGRVQGAPD
jgi:transposase